MSCRGSPSSANAPPGLSIPLPRVCFMGAFGGIRTRVHTRPQGRESNKDSRPVRSTTDSYEGIRAGDFLSFIASRKHGIGLPATLGYVHSDVERAERVRYAVRTGQCYATQGVRRIQGGYEKRVQTKSPRFEPSNPLTIMPCTSRNVKSSRVGKAACARRRDGRAAVPSRSCRPVGSCHDCATSRSCSRRIGTRIRAGVRRIPLP